MLTIENRKQITLQTWVIIAVVLASIFAFFNIVNTVSAAGATQIRGTGYFDTTDECDSGSMGADFALVFNGDLEGCVYTYVETFSCTPSGVYMETGREIFVGVDKDGNEGSFSTTYRFTAKYEDCANLSGQIVGRCQHPIVAGSGTGGFEGVDGRFDIKDDVETGTLNYRGHLKFN